MPATRPENEGWGFLAPGASQAAGGAQAAQAAQAAVGRELCGQGVRKRGGRGCISV